MRNPATENLFLRDPRNRAFVEGERDGHNPRYPNDSHPAFAAIIASIGCAMVGVFTILGFAEARRDALSACGPEPGMACYFSGPYSAWPCLGGFLLLWAASAVSAWGMAIRFPARVRRLRQEGVISYGKVTDYTPWQLQIGDEAPDYYEMTLHYSVPVAGKEAIHEELIHRGTHEQLSLPSAGSRVAVLYVDEHLWELL